MSSRKKLVEGADETANPSLIQRFVRQERPLGCARVYLWKLEDFLKEVGLRFLRDEDELAAGRWWDSGVAMSDEAGVFFLPPPPKKRDDSHWVVLKAKTQGS